MIFRIHNPVAARVVAYKAVKLIPVIPPNVARKTVKENPVALRRRLRSICDKDAAAKAVVVVDVVASLSSWLLAKCADNDEDDNGDDRVNSLKELLVEVVVLVDVLVLVIDKDDRETGRGTNTPAGPC